MTIIFTPIKNGKNNKASTVNIIDTPGIEFTPLDTTTIVDPELTDADIARGLQFKFEKKDDPFTTNTIIEPSSEETEPNDIFTNIKNFFKYTPVEERYEDTKFRDFNNVKELWQTPLGFSEESIIESRKHFGDPDTIIGKFNSVIIEGGVKFGDLVFRSIATPLVYGTGLAGDVVQQIESIIDITPFSPETAGDNFTRDLNAGLMTLMGLGRGTFIPRTIKRNNKDLVVLENIKTGELVFDAIAYARRSGRTKAEVISEVKKALDKDIARIKKEEIIRKEQEAVVNQQNAQIQTNNRIVKAQQEGIAIETVKPVEAVIPKKYNFASAIDDVLSRKDLDTAPRVRRDNVIQRQSQKALDYIYNTVGYRLSPLGALPRKDQYLKQRYGTFGKLLKTDKISTKIFDGFKSLTPEIKDQVFSFLTNKDAKSNIITDAKARTNAIDVKRTINNIGQELVKRKLLPQELIDSQKGSYLPRLYLKYLRQPTNLGYTKTRKDLTDEERLILGEITDPTVLAPIGISNPTKDMVFMDFLNEIGQFNDWVYQPSLIKYKGAKVSPVWLKDEAQRIQEQLKTQHNFFAQEERKQLQDIANEMDQLATENIALQRNLPQNKSGEVTKFFTELPKEKKYGTMAGALVRKEIYDDIVSSYAIINNPNFLDNLLHKDGYLTKLNQLWKMNKVVLNPPTQVRNFTSNMILMHLSGVSLNKIPVRILESAKDIATNGPYYQIAVKYGVPQTTFSNREIFKLTTEFERVIKKYNKPESIWQALGQIAYAVADNPVTRKASDIYQFSETLGKVAKIIDEIKKGASEGDAVLAAQEALFDYSLVPKTIEGLRKYPVGSPFITFQYKAVPRMLESLLKRPHKFLPYFALTYAMAEYIKNKYEISSEDFEKLKKAMPEYIREKKNNFLLPVKDKHGRWQVFDFSYLLPWSLLTESGQDIMNITTKGEGYQELFSNTGLFGGAIPQLLTSLQANYDPFSKKAIYNENDPVPKKIGDYFTYLWNLGMPPWLTDLGIAGKLQSYVKKEVDFYGDPKLDLTQTLLRGLGMNIYPIDPEKSRSTNLYFMKKKIEDVKTRKKQLLRDPNTTIEDKRKINATYNQIIRELTEQLIQYQNDSRVPDKLKIQNNEETNNNN
tara:strand:- start:52 stop:3441 length:3390 start_codon:yes stop_codon:yes gene_type:complete